MLARLRALTHYFSVAFMMFSYCRNDVSPFKGIDTSSFSPFRFLYPSRNDVSPFKGIDTPDMAPKDP